MNVNVKTINVSLNNYMYDAIEIKSRGFLGELTIIFSYLQMWFVHFQTSMYIWQPVWHIHAAIYPNLNFKENDFQ